LAEEVRNKYYGKVKTGDVGSMKTKGTTHEYVETQYFYPGSNTKGKLGANQFWVDVIGNILNEGSERGKEGKGEGNMKAGFSVSPNVIYATRSECEVIYAMIFSDFNLKKTTNILENIGSDLKVTVPGNALIFTKEVSLKSSKKLDLDLMISQNFFDPLNRYSYSEETNLKVLKKITEFLTGKIYGSRVAITNPSDSEYEIQVLTEIPQGAITVRKLDYFKSTT
jgi:hypothetical protein